MGLETIGIVMGIIALGLTFYFNKQQRISNDLTDGDVQHLQDALLALQKEFTQYQVDQKRIDEKETAKKEIRFDNIARSIKKNEGAIYSVNKRLPEEIRKTISHIEFARPLDKK